MKNVLVGLMILMMGVMNGWTKNVADTVSREEGTEMGAPYFLVQGDPSVDGFPLLKTEVRSSIAGISADVELVQVYKNNGKKTIEAVYVFPLGTRAAVHGVTMKIGNRVIEAAIEKKETARQQYTEAKQNGQSATLLEQQRPNVFQMNVANILPGDVIEVIVQYTEILVPEQGTYSFVFPTVVGPRYTGEASGKESWAATPYLHQGNQAPYDFSMAVTLKSGIPLANIWSPSHNVAVHEEGRAAATVVLAAEDTNRGNKDFILNYTFSGAAIQAGLLLYPSDRENYFLLMMEPPARVQQEDIPGREYLFIVDVSGSMHGFPLDTAKALMTQMIDGLRQKDYFNILFFSDGSSALAPMPLAATAENKAKARQMMASFSGGGGTELLHALRTAYDLEKKEGISRSIIAVTDGYVNVEREAFDLIRGNLNDGNFFAFGIGSSVNRYLIEGMARVGRGEAFIVTNPQESEAAAARFIAYTRAPVLTDIAVAYEGFEAYDVEPPAVGDLFAERPLILFGKYRKATGSIRVAGTTPHGRFSRTIPVTKGLEQEQNSALEYLWARERIARLDDYAKLGADTAAEVTSLGLAYHLMTQYTSFIAIDTRKRGNGEIVTVKQPLPLPEGVSDTAVGGYRCMQSMKACQSAAGAVVCERSKSDVLGDRAAAPRPALTKKEKLSVTAVSSPWNLRAYVFEKKYLPAIAGGLERLCARNQVRRMRVQLTVNAGIVTAVQTIGYQGNSGADRVIGHLFKKLHLPRQYTGTMEVEFTYY
jgi:Ca-activated chloride channel family protein